MITIKATDGVYLWFQEKKFQGAVIEIWSQLGGNLKGYVEQAFVLQLGLYNVHKQKHTLHSSLHRSLRPGT